MANINREQDILWLAHLATSRELIVIPTANCIGHILNKREDAGGHAICHISAVCCEFSYISLFRFAGVDPNRDFAYVRHDDHCLRSATARIFNRIFAESMIQVLVTYHAGMVALAYEWGSLNHARPTDAAPDNEAHALIAKKMREYAGTFPGTAVLLFSRCLDLGAY